MRGERWPTYCEYCGSTTHNTAHHVYVGAVPAEQPNPAFHAMLKEIAQLHDAKSQDYATDTNRYSNFEYAAEVAGCSVDTVFRVMIGIKLARLKVLLASGKPPVHESVKDSKRDLAVYGVLWASYPGDK